MLLPVIRRQANAACSIEQRPAYHSPSVPIRAQSRLKLLLGSPAFHQVKRRRLAIHCDSSAVSVKLIHTGSAPILASNCSISSGVRGTANKLPPRLLSQAANPSLHWPLPVTFQLPSKQAKA